MRRGPAIAIVAVAGGAFAVVAEFISAAGVAGTIADLATGVTVFACGLWGCYERPTEWRWPLLAFGGVAWFAGNFADSGSALVSSVGSALIYLHRGPLVHASAVSGRSRPRLVVAAIVGGYVAALATGTFNGVPMLLAAVLLGALAAPVIARAGLRRPRHDVLVAVSQLVLSGGLALAGVTALAQVQPNGAQAALYGYEAALAASALLLAASLVSQSRTRTTLTDLVVELGPARLSHGARVGLARALGDASLQVGYWMADGERYVDADGRSVSLPSDEGGRTATMIERDGVALAVLVHDRALLDDSLLTQAMHDATALVLANVRLEAEVATTLGELRASSGRILQARDDQRRRLARRLHDGAERRLGEVASGVARARAQAPPEVRALELFDVLERELKQAREEVAALAQGIHPRDLVAGGLAAALPALVDRAPVSIELITPAARFPAPIEVAAYFVCSEAVTNVTKYSCASHARCEVSRDDRNVHVKVVDDGIGGADPQHGSGLRGLADRIDALGGTFSVTSPPGQGTTVHAELPLDGSWLTAGVEW